MFEQAIPLSTPAKAFLKKISQANGNLARLSGMLYRIQKGEIKIANFTNNNNHEWTIIWDAYNQAKKNMVTPARI